MPTVKEFILDTNVLIDDPESIFKMGDNNIIIPDVVIDELDHFKTENTERGANVRKVTNFIDKLSENGSLRKGVRIGEGLGKLRVGFTKKSQQSNDDHIVELGLSDTYHGAIIVSKDTNLRIRARAAGILAENYKNDQVYDSPESKGYAGRTKVYLPPSLMEDFKTHGRLDIIDILEEGFSGDGGTFDEELTQNEFIEMYPIGKAKGSALLGRVDNHEIVKLFYADAPMSGVQLRNIGQYFMKECLLAPAKDAPLVIIKGPAGTAKTFFAIAAGLEKYKNQNEKEGYNRILVCRPSVMMDKDPGALPGDEKEKIAPLMRPIKDNIFNIQNPQSGSRAMSPLALREADAQVEGLFEDGIIKTESLAFLRGRTLNNYWFILDEMQNSTPIQAKSIVTRMGKGSKVILLGDPEQIDNPRNNPRSNGLVYASEKMKGADLCWQIQLKEGECERSALAQEAARRM